ncbi:kinase-like domain, phloem protein 2-like protein [Tanacetum coccineum]
MAAEDVAVPAEVAAPAPALGEPMDIMTALQLVLRKSLAHGGLVRGLHGAAKVIEKHAAQLCVLAEDCDQPDYIKLVKALCADHNVSLVTVPNAKTLGEWAGLCKIDSEGKARKVVGCSCLVVKDYGEESEGLHIVQEYNSFLRVAENNLSVPLNLSVLSYIKSATNNFDESEVIGTGGFGKVYAGELSHSQSEEKSVVAIKRLDHRYGQGDPEFFKEMRMLSCYRHENLISLLGFCCQGGEMILIYEYASRGSLDRYLSSTDLTWTQRIRICIDAAKGLSFLHDPNRTQQRVLHCDIKSANILLDKNMTAKVSDFGLSKMGPANQQYSLLIVMNSKHV